MSFDVDAPFSREFDGISDEVYQYLLQSPWIATQLPWNLLINLPG